MKLVVWTQQRRAAHTCMLLPKSLAELERLDVNLLCIGKADIGLKILFALYLQMHTSIHVLAQLVRCI